MDLNVAFICEPFCALVLIKEQDLDHKNPGTDKNWVLVHKTNNEVISGQTTFLRKKINLVVDEENRKLSNIYWTRKLHKNPSKARFIIAANQCSVKPWSETVTLLLKLMYKQIKYCNSKMYYFSGVN